MNCDTEIFDVVKFFNEGIGPYAAHLSEKYECAYKLQNTSTFQAVHTAVAGNRVYQRPAEDS
jgi:hypothetical protein